MKPTKNKKRIDPRYFLNETITREEQNTLTEGHSHDYSEPDPHGRPLTREEAEEAERLGYIDPYDDGFRNATGAKRYLQDKESGQLEEGDLEENIDDDEWMYGRFEDVPGYEQEAVPGKTAKIAKMPPPAPSRGGHRPDHPRAAEYDRQMDDLDRWLAESFFDKSGREMLQEGWPRLAATDMAKFPGLLKKIIPLLQQEFGEEANVYQYLTDMAEFYAKDPDFFSQRPQFTDDLATDLGLRENKEIS